MKVFLVGSGGQGAPCASILSNDKDVEEIKFADVNLDSVNNVLKKIDSSKFKPVKVDASNPDEIATEASGYDVIIDFTPIEYSQSLMEASLMSKTHYVNSAFGRDLWDYDLQVGKRPKMYEKFKKANLTALLGCGMSPGYTNVIISKYARQMDKLESVRIRLAKKDTSISENEELLLPWNPGWSPKVAFMDFVNSVTCFENGKYKTYDTPFSGIENYNFPFPVGEIPVSLHAHEEPYTLPTTLASKGLKYCDFKYYVNKQVAPMVALGFGKVPYVEIGDFKVDPLEVLMKLVPKPSDASLDYDEKLFEYQDSTKKVFINMELIGYSENKKTRYLITIPDMNNNRKHNYSIFGTTQINVALPAVIGAKMIAHGAEDGIIFPEELDPEKFLNLMEISGFINAFTEDIYDYS